MAKNVSKYILTFIANAVISLVLYIKLVFGYVSFEQIYFTLQTNEGSSINSILKGVIFVICGALILTFIIKILDKILIKLSDRFYLKFTYKKKTKDIMLFSGVEKRPVINSIIYLVFSFILLLGSLGVGTFIINQFSSSTIYEDYYVKASNTKITFPEEKQNLIYIFIESLETSLLSSENGGSVPTTYLPNLEKLANEHISFSNNDKLGGLYTPYGTTWTAGALIGHTSGTPLKISIDGNSYSNLNGSFPGIINLGDILKNNGYKNYFMLGSEAEFGGRKDYFTYHGDYTIFDYNYAIENNLIPKGYFNWWGYEDSKLYQFAKDKLLEISKNDEPFNFTMLTADSHFPDGYVDPSCEVNFSNHYANSFNCADKMLFEFITWITEQEFYKNTTIIVVGDHLSMQTNFLKPTSGYERMIYNLIMNSKVTSENTKNRKATTFDMFPTTLASLGCEIEGNKLAFGTNLYSDEPTLTEKLGYQFLDTELSKKSFMYDIEILADTYYTMQKYSVD